MDNIVVNFMKNRAELIAKGKQLIQHNYVELNQAIHIHPGPKLTDKVLEDKQKEFTSRHLIL